ncbi:hypothetical protein W327_02568, partial [Staphylococcus aureus DAR5848]
KKQKSKTSFTGAFDFLVQKGLMGQPHFFAFNIILIKDIWTNDNHIDLSVRPFSL